MARYGSYQTRPVLSSMAPARPSGRFIRIAAAVSISKRNKHKALLEVAQHAAIANRPVSELCCFRL